MRKPSATDGDAGLGVLRGDDVGILDILFLLSSAVSF